MKRSWLPILLILGTACRPQPSPSKIVTPVQVQRITPSGAPTEQSGLTFPTRTVVDDPATFDSLWRQAFASTGDSPALPAVDWQREKVVFAALGTRPSGGYSVEVTAIQQIGDELQITVETTTPGPHCMNTFVMTQPVDVVRIPRPGVGILIRFVERERTRDCP